MDRNCYWCMQQTTQASLLKHKTTRNFWSKCLWLGQETLQIQDIWNNQIVLSFIFRLACKLHKGMDIHGFKWKTLDYGRLGICVCTCVLGCRTLLKKKDWMTGCLRLLLSRWKELIKRNSSAVMANCKPNEIILPGSAPPLPMCNVGSTSSLWLTGSSNKLEHVDTYNMAKQTKII